MRDFKGLHSLQEVECTGSDLKPEVDLLSLSMFRISDNAVLGTLHVIKNSCFTHTDQQFRAAQGYEYDYKQCLY